MLSQPIWSEKLTFYLFPGCRDEAVPRRWLRRGRQPHLLQREHRDAAGRRKEVVRRTTGEAQGALRTVVD